MSSTLPVGAWLGACQASEPPLDADVDAGGDVIQEAAHAIPHRPVATPCSTSRPPGTMTYFPVDGGCDGDLACAEGGVNGRCNTVFSPVSTLDTNVCTWDTCFADDACAGMACACREDFPRAGNMPDHCATVGNCRTDVDCVGQLCSPNDVPSCAPAGWFCHTSFDECMSDLDCTNPTMTKYCAWVGAQMRWMCVSDCLDG